MSDPEFIAEMRKALRSLAKQLTDFPFADVVMFNGKFVPRSQARAIERALWPLAFPKVGDGEQVRRKAG